MKKWYVVTTYSGYENAIKQDLERKRYSMNMENDLLQILVPEETVVCYDKQGNIQKDKLGNTKTKVQKIYPGYVFVEVEIAEGKDMDENVWFNIRNTQNVTGFLGSSGGGTKPVPIPSYEMEAILKKVGLTVEPKFDLSIGDTVVVIGGSFADQSGDITKIDEEKGTVSILVDFFGRATEMEFPISDVKKM